MSNFNAGGLCTTTFYEVSIYSLWFFLSFLYKSYHYLVKSIMCFYVVPFGVGVSPQVNLESLSSHYT